jgi:hypothetical protein
MDQKKLGTGSELIRTDHSEETKKPEGKRPPTHQSAQDNSLWSQARQVARPHDLVEREVHPVIVMCLEDLLEGKGIKIDGKVRPWQAQVR